MRLRDPFLVNGHATQQFICFQVTIVEFELKLYAKYEGRSFLFTNKLFSFAFEKAAQTSSGPPKRTV